NFPRVLLLGLIAEQALEVAARGDVRIWRRVLALVTGALPSESELHPLTPLLRVAPHRGSQAEAGAAGDLAGDLVRYVPDNEREDGDASENLEDRSDVRGEERVVAE